MTKLIFQILGVAFVVWIIWTLNQLRYAVEIRISKGEAKLRRGRATPAFLLQVTEICTEYGVAKGWIGGINRAGKIILRFSNSIPAGAQQRIRNEWQIAG